MEQLILILVICTFWNVLLLLWKVSNKNSDKSFADGYDSGYRSGQRDAMKEFKIINDRIREKELVRFKRISEGILNDLEGFNKKDNENKQ